MLLQCQTALIIAVPDSGGVLLRGGGGIAVIEIDEGICGGGESGKADPGGELTESCSVRFRD